jgi:hypothetical protein
MMARVNVPFNGSATRKKAMELPEEGPDTPVIIWPSTGNEGAKFKFRRF